MSDAVLGHLVFSVGPALYAVPAPAAHEVVNAPGLTRVPGTPAHVLGVFAHRGEVVPVVDVARLFGGAGALAFRRVVLVRGEKGLLGLTAARVLGVQRLEGKAERLGAGGVERCVLGPLAGPGGDVMALDADALIEFLAAAPLLDIAPGPG